MRTDKAISQNQLASAAFVLMLSPALRLFPSAAAARAGKGAWLSALLAFPAAAAALWLARRALADRREGEGLCALIARAAPGRAGRAALALLGIWLCVYAGFVLRSGADRFLVTVYPNTPAAFFILSMAAAALPAAMAPLHRLARTVKLLLPALGLILALVLLSSLGRLRAENLLPLSLSDAPGLLSGSVAALDVLLWSFYAAAMLLGGVKKGSVSCRALLPALGALCALLSLMSAEIVGSFGAPLAAELSWPFFSLVRNLVFFRSIERVEALVVALWVFPDFLIAALFWNAARRAFSLALSGRFPRCGASKALLPLCAGASVVFALLAAPDAEALRLLSGTVIPAVNLFFALLFFPALLGIGRLRGRI